MKVGERESMEGRGKGGGGGRRTQHRSQLKHLHQITARTPLETDVKLGISTKCRQLD